MQRNIKRKTKKITTKIQSERTTTLRVNFITNYQSPESIVKIILDKIINLSIRQSGINKINKHLKNFCFDYIQSQIEPLFEENYINYTSSNKNSNILFWKKKIPNEKKWVEIMEPDTPKDDRFEGAFANIKELELKNKKPKINKIKEGKEKEVLINNSKNSVSFNEEENKNELKNKKNIKKFKLIENNENTSKEEDNTINKTTIQQMNISSGTKKNNKRIQMINFPSMDIPDIEKDFNHQEYEPPNINKLRKEIEKEKKRREIEAKFRGDDNKSIKKQNDSDKINKKPKQLDSNTFTFDSNGQIISFRQYKLEDLTKDFQVIRNNIKDNIESIKALKKKTAIIKTENVINEEEIIKNPAEEEKAQKLEKNEKKEKIIPSGSNFQIILPNIGVVIKENQKIKRGGREFNKYFNKYSISDYDKILNDYVPLQNKAQMKNKIEKMNSTSNNNSMIQKIMSESVDNPIRNKNINNNKNFNTINNKTFNYNNFNNSNDNLNSNSNPLLVTNDNIKININDTENNLINNSYLKTSIGVNSFNKNSNKYNPLMTSFKLRSTFIKLNQGKRGNSFNDSITMKKAGTSSLKVEIDSLDDLKNDKAYYGPINLKQKNIFGKNFMKNYKIGLIKPRAIKNLASFNKSILNNTNW